jgi:putative membrane protein
MILLALTFRPYYYYPTTMMPYFAGWWFFFPFGFIFFFFIIFAIGRLLFWPWRWGYRSHYWHGHDEAADILRQRYARGEITKDQFAQMMRDLEQHG